eukprot:TRINITY_DN9518_c1_g1_i1.p1 TRINITY_DN9518_c1_g1~~TRINITY_DN9518_c1_g1_i1.p1  ORF type:complete len:439 (-),score=81.05 TRINITY_DN9518_c1_g1_i1:63-1379(-)
MPDTDGKDPSRDLKECVGDVLAADFVAVDVKGSGQFLNIEDEGTTLTMEQYFTQCVESVPHFFLVQLGICCARHNNGKWELRSYEFDLWPQARRVFSADMQTLRSLRTHGFDFNAFFQRALPYARLPAQDGKLENHQHDHATNIMYVLRHAKVPLVFHNGFVKILHLYDKFIGDIPKKLGDFGKAWGAQFPLLFDTRAIAQEARCHVLLQPEALSLTALHGHCSGLVNAKLHCEHRPFQVLDGSAGHNATKSAELFLMEINALLSHLHASHGSSVNDVKESSSRGGSKVDRSQASAGCEGGKVHNSNASPGCGSVSADGDGDTSRSARKRRRKNDGSAVAGDGAGEAEDVQMVAADEKKGDVCTDAAKSQKRSRASQDAGAKQKGANTAIFSGALCTPSLFESHEVCLRFQNRAAVVGAPTSFVDVGMFQLLRGFSSF